MIEQNTALSTGTNIFAAEIAALPSALHSQLQKNVSLTRYNAWRVGGIADYCFFADELSQLQQLLQTLPATIPVTILGHGSNVLIRDGGIRGVVVLIRPGLVPMQMASDTVLRAGAGIHCARVARFAADRALTGTEFLVGIPGNIGGALIMNAGAWGTEIWDLVIQAELLDRDGRLYQVKKEDIAIAYRSVSVPAQHVFVSCLLQLHAGTCAAAHDQIQQYLQERSAKQPVGTHNCGSVFRNPVGDYAARLIQACELGGYRIGGAVVSQKHTNFIVNSDQATAEDIEQLIALIQQRVEQHFGVRLQTEVCILGEQQ